MQKNNAITNFKSIIDKAFKNNYAIAQININNLEWTIAALQIAQESKTPIILGVSKGAKNYMGSYKLIYSMVNELINSNAIDVDVVLHLDHGDYEDCIEAINANFPSIMFDGSKLDFEDNLNKTRELAKLCEERNISLEVEIGSIGGYEDGITSRGEKADINQCIEMAKENIDLLAASIGNIHGVYPDNWEGLDFKLLEKISNETKKPLVLHGGSGIDEQSIKKAISLGICKVNVNTECQIAFTKAISDYLKVHTDLNNKNTYDPRNYLKIGMKAIKEVILEKFKLFGSYNVLKK